jgi:hypothetical protein
VLVAGHTHEPPRVGNVADGMLYAHQPRDRHQPRQRQAVPPLPNSIEVGEESVRGSFLTAPGLPSPRQ